jgi:hypothetical protein
MTTVADLHRAVQATVAGKRLGRPVFVRYLFQSEDKPEAVLPRLAQATAAVRDWLGQPLERVYALGAAAGGQVSLTLEFSRGATAVVGWSRGRPRGAGVDVLVIGDHGALYHDAGTADLWDEAAAAAEDAPDPRIQDVIERALGSGKPEPVGKGARP